MGDEREENSSHYTPVVKPAHRGGRNHWRCEKDKTKIMLMTPQRGGKGEVRKHSIYVNYKELVKAARQGVCASEEKI